MDWINDVQKAINFIETNLLENIYVEDVAEHIFSSKDHFQKVFFHQLIDRFEQQRLNLRRHIRLLIHKMTDLQI